DATKGRILSNEEVFLMLGDDLEEKERKFIISYLNKVDFRNEVTVTDELLIKENKVCFIPGNGIPPFSMSIQQFLTEIVNWYASNTVIHPDGHAAFVITPEQLIKIKIIADTRRELA
ncbi:MAG: hypothetical protein PHY32_04735, partial [Candidatus Pacebacteria bacterium]|nr:hypothetical protein [Candidatus Paceibacterota bacterium]